MRNSPLWRLTGLLVASLVSLSAPVMALGHGYAHHEASEHAANVREHHHDARESTAAPVERTMSVERADTSGDHGHPELSLALSARADGPLFIPAESGTLSFRVLIESQVSLLLTAAPPRAGPPDAPPRQPRAPPLG